MQGIFVSIGYILARIRYLFVLYPAVAGRGDLSTGHIPIGIPPIAPIPGVGAAP